MNALLRANRLEVTDRFPMLGYTIRTDGSPQRAEVALATDPALLLPQNKGRRTAANFYSSSQGAALRVPSGEAVFLVPPEVVLRFAGQDKLYAALALTPERSGSATQVAVLPDATSPYVSIRGLTGRGLRRVRLLPTRQDRTGSYGDKGALLEWAGDALLTGAESVEAKKAEPARNGTNGSNGAGAKPSVDYDDGFGPLPPTASADAPAVAKSTPPAPAGPAAPGGGESAALNLLARAQEIIQPFYEPDNPSTALTCQNDAFSHAREEWFAGVPNTTLFPHSAICLLEMKDAPGSIVSRGTGFYIGPQRVLTCAHNLHGKASVDIVPGNNDANEPFGRCNVASGSWRISNRYPAEGHRYDLAVIDDVPIAAPGGSFFDFLRATPSQQMQVVVCGYSSRSDLVPELTQAINGRKQHLHAGYVESVDDETLDYPILTLKRASGSPVYHIRTGPSGALEASVVGVHVSGEPAARGLNRGCFLTPAKLDWIEGRTTALRATARGLEIPLDPGAGGMSIGVDALAPADIIVSTTRHPVSYLIRGGTLSAVSHTMLYAGDGKVIEAVGDGVREIAIETALAGAILAVAYRDPRVTPSSAAAIVAHARSRVGNPYNIAGVAFIGYRVTNALAGYAIDHLAGRLGLEVGQAGAVYCSELILEAFAQGGLPLTPDRPGGSTPEDVVQMARSALGYVGHLKAENATLGIPLGLALQVRTRRAARAFDASAVAVGAERMPVAAPSIARLPPLQRAAVEAALLTLVGPIGPMIATARAAASAAGVSIGIGPSVGAGLGGGGALGVGIVFGPDGGIGAYGAAEIDVGWIASISATVQVTVVRGGIEAFNGWGMAAVVSAGECIVGGAAALFDAHGAFQGVSFQVGVGAGLSPVDVYVAVQRQVATQLGVAMARAHARTVRALDAAGATVGSERAPATAPSVQRLSSLQRAALEAALLAFTGPLAPVIVTARAAASAAGVSIGIGPAVGAGLGAGGALGTGVIFGPDGDIGVYGAAEIDIGFIASISATVQFDGRSRRHRELQRLGHGRGDLGR